MPFALSHRYGVVYSPGKLHTLHAQESLTPYIFLPLRICFLSSHVIVLFLPPSYIFPDLKSSAGRAARKNVIPVQ